MRARARLASMVALVFAPCLSSPVMSSEPAGDFAALAASKRALLDSFAPIVGNCVIQQDTQHQAFHGCIDWHSAVHGTWALIAIMRAAESNGFDGIIGETLTPSNILAETELLAKRPDFEMPYGRAWFLRLAIDYRRHYATGELDDMAHKVSVSLERWLTKEQPSLLAGSYGSTSWAYINLIDYLESVGAAGRLALVRNDVRDRLEREDLACRYEDERGQFMAICTNLMALASRVMERTDFERWLGEFIAGIGLPEPVEKPISDHHYGLNFSRAWGLWDAYSLTGDQRFRDAYAAHVLAGFRDFEREKNDYGSVGHWVGQFGVYAIQPLF